MKRVFGNSGGLKANQIRKLENLYRRRIPPEYLITPEIVQDLCGLSFDIRRQVGLLINRMGKIGYVIVGTHHGIVIPDISEYRVAPGRLRGLRCVHTHLSEEKLTPDDLTDLSLLRLDMMAVVTVTQAGRPAQIHAAHILPSSSDRTSCQVLPHLSPAGLDIGCLELIQALEEELTSKITPYSFTPHVERALLVSVDVSGPRVLRDSMAELEELALSSGIEVIGRVVQQRRLVDPRFLMGLGKLQDLSIQALQKGATVLIFNQDLNPSQMRSITDLVDIKVIDRTQLILDIFAQRAQTREGKLQVELAQLKYLLPRLATKNTAMSRLTGGIGGRGPGETKLEINRRRVYDRIARLEDELSCVIRQRRQQRAKRMKRGLPVISIIGYTNAGKSTLLNTLTKSTVLAESRLFATLDPSSRRLKFPRDTEVIITDTVGFIKNLPRDLMVAFRATLEALENADLLLHVIDISSPRCHEQMQSVEDVLSDLNLKDIPIIRVLNKQDLVDEDEVHIRRRIFEGIPISANDKFTLFEMIEKMESVIEQRTKNNFN